MSNWITTTEDDITYHVNEELGNVVEIFDKARNQKMYIAMMPLVCKFGPYNNLDQAKAILHRKEEVRTLVDTQFDTEG